MKCSDLNLGDEILVDLSGMEIAPGSRLEIGKVTMVEPELEVGEVTMVEPETEQIGFLYGWEGHYSVVALPFSRVIARGKPEDGSGVWHHFGNPDYGLEGYVDLVEEYKGDIPIYLVDDKNLFPVRKFWTDKSGDLFEIVQDDLDSGKYYSYRIRGAKVAVLEYDEFPLTGDVILDFRAYDDLQLFESHSGN